MNRHASRLRWLARSVIWASVLPVILLPACGPVLPALTTSSDNTADQGRLLLLDTEGLEPAYDGNQRTYKPGPAEAVDPDDPSAGQANGFFLRVATNQPDSLVLWINDEQRRASSPLVRVTGPTYEPEFKEAAKPRPFNQKVRDYLREGNGVYWVTRDADLDQPFANEVAILVPQDLLSPFSTLRVSAAVVHDTPVHTVDIRLVNDFFYMAVVGDSVQWGNGLMEPDKMSTIVAEQIETALSRKVIVQRLAQNGAEIVPTQWDAVCPIGCYGEVPLVYSSITTQVRALDQPDRLDLILLNGCINDVGLDTILNPFSTAEEVIERTSQYCGMEMATLLHTVRAQAPQAAVVVTGYYPIVSELSDPFGIERLAAIQGYAEPEAAADAVAQLTMTTTLFATTANDAIAQAVDQVNETYADTTAIRFADPQFKPENAVFAPESWLWGMTSETDLVGFLDLGFDVFPEDPVHEIRLKVCATRYGLDSLLICAYASVGHPNTDGANAYANAVVTQLKATGLIP